MLGNPVFYLDRKVGERVSDTDADTPIYAETLRVLGCDLEAIRARPPWDYATALRRLNVPADDKQPLQRKQAIPAPS